MSQNTDTQLLIAFSDFIQDAKPYHTKLREFVSELEFRDEMTVQLIDEKSMSLYYQGAWGRDSVGGDRLFRVMSGTTGDLSFRIPATVYPRFSLNDSLNYGQTPHGYDPATHVLTDADSDGVPDVEDPWTGGFTYSHQEGVTDEIQAEVAITLFDVDVTAVTELAGTYTYTYDIQLTLDRTEATIFGWSTVRVTVNEADFLGTVLDAGNDYTLFGLAGVFTPTVDDLANLPPSSPSVYMAYAYYAIMKELPRVKFYYIETGRYYTPFHQGAKIRVNGVPQQYVTDFLVDPSRSFIQFTDGNHPVGGDKIDINLMTSDRLFLTYQEPFSFNLDRSYDIANLDLLQYDTDDVHVIIKDYFTLTINDAQPDRYDPVTFFNGIEDSNKGTMDDIVIDPSATDGDVWTITAVNFWVFSVQKTTPLSSTIQYAYFRTPFDNGEIAFTITSTWLEYYLTEDVSHYGVYDENLLDYFVYAIPTDDTDYLVNLGLKTEHGVVNDPQPPDHSPIVFNEPNFEEPIGVVKQVLENTPQGPQPSYRFEFLNAPPQGTYVELRAEQFGQINQRASAEISEYLQLTQILVSGEEVVTTTMIEGLTHKSVFDEVTPVTPVVIGATVIPVATGDLTLIEDIPNDVMVIIEYPDNPSGIYVWGSDGGGELGIGGAILGYKDLPFQTGGLYDLKSFWGGAGNIGHISQDGTWITGQAPVGDSTILNRSFLTFITGDTWEMLGFYGGETRALHTDGTIWGWGTTQTGVSSPIQLSAETDWVYISKQGNLALKADGSMWGLPTNGNSSPVIVHSGPWQMVDGSFTYPMVDPGAPNFFNLKHAYALHADGSIWTWGFNTNGQLGDGSTISKPSPTQIGSAGEWNHVASGGEYVLAVKTDGTLWSWGNNDEGQLGVGDLVSRSSPVQVSIYDKWSHVTTSSLSSRGLLVFGVEIAVPVGSITAVGSAPEAFGPNLFEPGTSELSFTGKRPLVNGIPDNTMWGVGLSNNGELGVE